MENSLIWGLIILVCGVFIATYGDKLFRFSLAFLGFALGVVLVIWLGGGLGATTQILASLVAGGILAMVFYFLVNFSLYIAGGVAGLVLMLAVLALFKLGGLDLGLAGSILALVATGAGVFFGRRLGNSLVVLATSLAGSYLVVLGLSALFDIGATIDHPDAALGASFPLVLFAAFLAISFLGQYQAADLRRRLLRRG